MSESQFIGRGENLSIKILLRLFPYSKIESQVPISKVITPEQYHSLDEVYKKHKFDFFIDINKWLAVEVNYKHGNKAAEKWANVFLPLLKKNGLLGMTIDDYDCRTLFKLNSKKEHKVTWDDFRDIIDALEKAGIKPSL
jgi:hypothetical protein